MRIIIAGGSGFLGRALSSALSGEGHHIQILTRSATRPPAPASAANRAAPGGTVSPAAQGGPGPIEYIAWGGDGSVGPWATPCSGADIVINLAGENIGGARWSAARKVSLARSRLLATRSLARFISESRQPPAALISASAIGIYGDRGDDTLTEEAPPGTGFLAELSVAWEQEASKARTGTTRVVLLRTGIVLDADHGALARMLLPFRLFAGGPFGSGRQFMSWIHRDDWVSLVRWAMEAPGLQGPVNLTSPSPVSNAAFARALAAALGRPALLPVPAAALRLVLGEMAGPLLLYSQRVVPARALAGGFTFAHPELDEALADLLVQ